MPLALRGYTPPALRRSLFLFNHPRRISPSREWKRCSSASVARSNPRHVEYWPRDRDQPIYNQPEKSNEASRPQSNYPASPRSKATKQSAQIRLVEQYLSRLSERPTDGQSEPRLVGRNDGSVQSRLRKLTSAKAAHALSMVEGPQQAPLDGGSTLLNETNYDFSDINEWAGLIAYTNPSELVASLEHAREDLELRSSSSKLIPLFVIQLLTSRKHLDNSLLGAILNYLAAAASHTEWAVLDPSQSSIGTHRTNFIQPVISERLITILELFSNLTYHARQTWPALREQIAVVFSQTLELFGSRMTRTSPSDATLMRGALGFCANAFMFVLARPSEVEPFKDLAHQELSQARLLRFMVTGSLPLELDRFGYRGIATTQLMQSKTAEESTWARLKALSWPPWKDDKTGMDAFVEPEHGVSRAAQTLDQMRAAGYSARAWERVARLYAGWDTDLSPIIQYRFYLAPLQESSEQAGIWAARIQCTRTIREAWAAFLAYQDSVQRLHSLVCTAMLEKILRESLRQKLAERQEEDEELGSNADKLMVGGSMEPAMAGDAMEVWPPPPSAHLEIYTRTEPPTLEQFLDEMKESSVKLSDKRLGHLLSIAPDWKSGKALLDFRRDLLAARDSTGLLTNILENKINPTLANALVSFYLRFPLQSSNPRYVPDDRAHRISEKSRTGDWRISNKVYNVAIHLVRSRPSDTTVASALLQSLAECRGFAVFDTNARAVRSRSYGLVSIDPDLPKQLEHLRPHIDRLVAFDLALEVEDIRREHCLPISLTQLRSYVSIAATSGASAQAVLSYLNDHQDDTTNLTTRLRHLALSTLSNIRFPFASQFFSAIESQSSSSSLPGLCLVPSPDLLHRFILGLSAAEDFEAMQRLVRFAKRHKHELHGRLHLHRSGKKGMHLALCALRAGLVIGKDAVRKDAEVDYSALLSRESAAPPNMVREIQTVVEELSREFEEWTWPELEDVRRYLEVGRRHALRSRYR